MKQLSLLRFGVAAALTISTLGACGSSDSRDRNVAELKGCAQGGPCQIGEVGPGGGYVVVGATEPGVDMWEVAPLNGYGTFLDAIGQLDDLNFGDVNGWTLPGANVNDSIRTQIAGFACADDTDCATQFGDATYWTSDMQDGKHVVVAFADGSTSVAEDESTHFIRPVRTFQMVAVNAETTTIDETSAPETTVTQTAPPDVTLVEESTTSVVVTEDQTTTSVEETTTTANETTTTASTTTTTEVPTTTTEPEPSDGDGSGCATGGTCEIGDTGPGGGIVFYVSVAPFSVPGVACGTNCHYLEAAPASAQFAAPATCAEQTPADAVNVSGIGQGFANTKSTADLCGNTFMAATAARAYRGGGRKDWYVPSFVEMDEMAKAANRVGGLHGYYWTSTQLEPIVAWWGETMATAVAYIIGVGYQRKTSRDPEAVRVIRAFGGSSVAPTTTTTTAEASTTTTIAEIPSTTVAPLDNQPCSKGGQCSPGDTGPGGGIILRADAYDSDSVTLFEVGPATWFANPKKATDSFGRMRLAGFNDWRMPTLSELAAMRAGRSQFKCAKAHPCLTGFANSKYWGVSETLGASVLDFASPSGTPSKADANELHYVRPVRTIEIIEQVEGQLVQPIEIQPPVEN